MKSSRRSAQALAALNHPNIAGIYEMTSVDGVSALVMELVEGQDRSELIAAGAKAPALQPDGAPGLQPGGIPLAEVLDMASATAAQLNNDGAGDVAWMPDTSPDGRTIYYGAQQVEASIWKTARKEVRRPSGAPKGAPYVRSASLR